VGGKLVEWADGEARIYANVPSHHARTAGFLTTLVNLYSQESGAGTAMIARYAMRARPGGNAREPDLTFIAEPNRHRIGVHYLEGPADIAVEVIAPDSVKRAREEKFAEYAADGVPEYWIIDPRPGQERADFYRLAGGRYETIPVSDGIVHSTQVPGFWLRIEWLWDRTSRRWPPCARSWAADPLA
jgi:Uma2 family endonuclease